MAYAYRKYPINSYIIIWFCDICNHAHGGKHPRTAIRTKWRRRTLKFRSRADICAEILEAAEEGSLKTRIMYSSRTSVKQLNPYLDLLIENDLLEHIPGEKIYRTTERGARFVQNYRQAWRILIPKDKKLQRQEALQTVTNTTGDPR